MKEFIMAVVMAITSLAMEAEPEIVKYIDHDVVAPAEDYWDGPVLTMENGTVYGPSGKETYYNLDMSVVVAGMRELGFCEDAYPYWIREDGCKMLGQYVMVAADWSVRPRGTIVDTSRGQGIVCDTGEFINSDQWQLDIAVNW